MKSFKLIVILVFSLLCGNNFVNAQELDSSNSEQPMPNKVTSKTAKKTRTKARKAPKKNPTKVVNKNETKKLHSKSEMTARALTAKKTKDSGKGNIPPAKAKKDREARIATIIEANKTKKKTPLKRKNNN